MISQYKYTSVFNIDTFNSGHLVLKINAAEEAIIEKL